MSNKKRLATSLRSELPIRGIAVRFWEKIIKGKNEDDCWSWSAAISNKGYGVLGEDRTGITIPASRVSWMLHFGEIPEGLHVCHHCDNPPCCNPKHLFVGTRSDNMQDCKAKGRMSMPPINNRFGEDNHKHRLSKEDILSIREEYANLPYSSCGHNKRLGTVTALAEKWKIGKMHLHQIVKREVWPHI